MDESSYDKHLEVVRHGLHQEFEGGDKLALLDCVMWCHSYGLPLPDWALETLAKASKTYMDGVSANFHDALFGARKKAGRHSNPAIARSESHKLLYNLVLALKKRGFKGDGLYDRAQELLGQLRLTTDGRLQIIQGKGPKKLEVETIKKRFEQMRKNGARPSGLVHLIPSFVDLGDPRRPGKK